MTILALHADSVWPSPIVRMQFMLRFHSVGRKKKTRATTWIIVKLDLRDPNDAQIGITLP